MINYTMTLTTKHAHTPCNFVLEAETLRHAAQTQIAEMNEATLGEFESVHESDEAILLRSPRYGDIPHTTFLLITMVPDHD